MDHLEQDADGAVAGSVVTLAERRLAVEHWLLSAADDRARARHEWRTDGYALLRCGGILGAVQISAAIVHAAAGCDEPLAVNSYLARALLGPAFVDRETLRYYALVGSSTGRRTEWNRSGTGAGFMGTGHYLGVPAVHVTSPTARLAWCVGMDSPGDLAPADAVCQLVHTGRYRLAGGERSLGG
ncbi:hypothetical protein [Streptomyces cinerochromogenes]|uniref:hypothetical protein n=1 Tax=Streptomyces cinerochromogenes TaxID=66422 RepID=UPI0033B79E14